MENLNPANFDWTAIAEKVQTLGVDLGIRIAAALAIFIIGRIVVKLVVRGLQRVLERQQVDATLTNFLKSVTNIGLQAFVILAAINQLGIQTTSLVALLGAAGLAIGLALQGSLSNFAAGVLIVLFRPYRVGDYIEAAGVSGSIVRVQIFTTVLHTPDNKEVIIPNKQVMDGVITNYSANPTRRIELIVGVSYDDNIDQVRDVINQLLQAEQRVLSEPASQIAVTELADSSVNFNVRCWVNTDDFWSTKVALTEAIKKRFDQENISFPYPQQDVHLYQSTQ